MNIEQKVMRKYFIYINRQQKGHKNIDELANPRHPPAVNYTVVVIMKSALECNQCILENLITAGNQRSMQWSPDLKAKLHKMDRQGIFELDPPNRIR
jgi:hypothetical protein